MDRRKAIKNSGLVARAAVMAPTFLSLLQSCKSETRLDWKPLFLNNDEANFISALVDTIPPKTETPGALDVKVDLFLDKVFAKTYDDAAQQTLKSNIQQFNRECTDQFGDSFSNLTDEDKHTFLK